VILAMTNTRPVVPGVYIIWFRPDLDMAPATVFVGLDGKVKRPEAPFPLSLKRQQDIIAWFGPIPHPDDVNGPDRVWKAQV
jgi:hypothetical protein